MNEQMLSEASASRIFKKWSHYLNEKTAPKQRKWKTSAAQEHLKIHIWKAPAVCCFVFASKTHKQKKYLHQNAKNRCII